MVDVATRLRSENLDPSQWSNGPGDRYSAHEHGYDKVIAVQAGSIAFGLPATGETVHLETGDRLELPAGTEHDARVGPDGVTCWEAHVARGGIPSVARRAAGEW
jgi:quercetin dioxygenase-like cupin family protein